MSTKITHFEIHGRSFDRERVLHVLIVYSNFRCAVPNVFDWGRNRCHVRQISLFFAYCFRKLPSWMNRNTDCDYSSAYVSIYTNSELVGHGMTFTIGRGNEIVNFFPNSFPCSSFVIIFILCSVFLHHKEAVPYRLNMLHIAGMHGDKGGSVSPYR